MKRSSETWQKAILDVLQKHAGPMGLQQIYAQIRPLSIVEPDHLELWGGQPMYHHYIRSELAKLKAQEKVKHLPGAKYLFISR